MIHDPELSPASYASPGSAGGWRLIPGDDAAPTPVEGAENMAIDRALLESVADGAPPVVRLYRWAPATLSFGRNQPARGLYDEGAAAERGIAFVRRPTGGQAVLHDDELTYAVVAPVPVIGKPRAAYARINRALVAALRSLGLPASLAEPGPPGELSPAGSGAPSASGRDWTAACFRRPERGEVVVGGRKLVGSAQRMEARTILQHGSILLGGSQAPAEALLRQAREGARPPGEPHGGEGGGARDRFWTTLEAELGGRPDLTDVVEAVASAFRGEFGIALARGALTAGESAAARALHRRFASSEWTWRR